MKYFLDTEFITDANRLELISLAIVAEDGRELYCENNEVDLSTASPWVKENVVPKLWGANASKKSITGNWSSGNGRGGYMTRKAIAREIRRFCWNDAEFWAYNAAYDWVCLIQTFGTMEDLPSHWKTHHIRDLKMLPIAGVVPEQNPATKHFALADARYSRLLYSLASA